MPRRGDCYTRSPHSHDASIEHLLRLVEKLTKEVEQLKREKNQFLESQKLDVYEGVNNYKDAQYYIENKDEIIYENGVYKWMIAIWTNCRLTYCTVSWTIKPAFIYQLPRFNLIRDFSKLHDIALKYRKVYPSKFFYIQSRPFKTEEGYFLVLLLYPNGYKGQLDKSLSLFFALVRHKEYEMRNPSWPFKLNSRLSIIDQDKDVCHKQVVTNMDSGQIGLFKQPKEERNGSFGTLNLLSLSNFNTIPGLTRNGVHIQLELSTGMFWWPLV